MYIMIRLIMIMIVITLKYHKLSYAIRYKACISYTC